MIPSALINGIWMWDACGEGAKESGQKSQIQIEIRALELWKGGFTFRISNSYGTAFGKGSFLLHFFDFEAYCYESIHLTSFSLVVDRKEKFYTIFRLSSEEDHFCRLTDMVGRQYLKYIRLCLMEEPGEVQTLLTGCKGTADETDYLSFEQYRQELYEEIRGKMKELLERFKEDEGLHMGLLLENKEQYEFFMKKDFSAYISWYLADKKVGMDPEQKEIFAKKCRYIGIGSQFCVHLFPDEETLFALLDKVTAMGKIPVLHFAPVEEWILPGIKRILKRLEVWAKVKKPLLKRSLSATGDEKEALLELVANDWGLLYYLREKTVFTVTPGVLLLKTKKDTRMEYKKGAKSVMEDEERCQTGWMSDEFCTYLKETYRIQRFSMDGLQSYPGEMSVNVTRYAPWYQMNTSTGCTLKAMCETGDRGKQKREESCQYYCKDHGFCYPKHLRMTGRYNTIFGFGSSVFEDVTDKNTDRIFWNFF